jgi:hypothetical protein
MISYDFLWFLMISYEGQARARPRRPNKIAQICGCLWFVWFLIIPYDFLWFLVSSYDFLWFLMIFMISYDLLWFQMISDFIWFLMISLTTRQVSLLWSWRMPQPAHPSAVMWRWRGNVSMTVMPLRPWRSGLVVDFLWLHEIPYNFLWFLMISYQEEPWYYPRATK